MDLWNETATANSSTEITVARCDPHKDLVWVGKKDGQISSYDGPLLNPYVSFVAHEGAVKDIQLSDNFVISLGEDGISSHTRNGLLAARCVPAKGDKLLVLDNTEFLVAYKRRVAKYTISPMIKEIGFFQIDPIPSGVSITHITKCSPNIALGLSDGTVEIIEPKTFDTTLSKPLQCHTGPITDLDGQKNLMVTCGLSQRRFGMVPDVFITCYDVRFSKPQLPLTVNNGASFVRLHPKSPNHAVVLGPKGQLYFLDSRNTSNITIKQMVIHDTAESLDIGPLGDTLIVTEKNHLHFWTNKTSLPVENFKGLDVPSFMDVLPPLSDASPLSGIGMPHYNMELLSHWNMNEVFETGIPTPNWDKVDSSLVAQSHESSVRRQAKYRRPSLVSVPRFLSEQARMGVHNTSHKDARGFAEILKTDSQSERGKVPKLWRRMHVHYSKFGVDDFDFSYYNNTDYSSLEPLSASPYCNALLQLYRWCPAIYNASLHTFAANNWKDLQATGELAIVLDMLIEAEGHHIRATNFMDALQLDMQLTEMHKVLMKLMIEEHALEIGGDSPLVQDIGTVGISTFNMLSEVTPAANVQLKTLPSYLFVLIEDADADSDRSDSKLVPSSIYMADPKDRRTDEEFFETGMAGVKQYAYDLIGYVSEVVDHDGERHGVAVIKVENSWYLFNDFMVTVIAEEDALDFAPSWKRPCMFMYSRSDVEHSYDQSWRNCIDQRLLHDKMPRSGNWENDTSYPDAMLKDKESIPEIVALDAEFVLIRKELAELHSDGTKHLLSPKKLSLARVSVLRDDEKVLIDDIVESNQPVVDYLTAFSGVEPGDLDPLTSRYGLVARKTATRRLWILLKLGTKFVGHALINDFRCINLYAPPSQVIDTINLFYDKDRNGLRRLSLKFLMWAVLGDHVQRGNHDSVQDAQSALRLYRRYEELERTGEVNSMLDELSLKGQQYNYKVPVQNETSLQ